MGLLTTVADVIPENWHSVCAFNRDSQRNFQRISSVALGPGSAPTFAGLSLTVLAAGQLVYANATKALTSVADLSAWVAGTTNQISVANDGDGTITVSTPQDIHTGATPEFYGLTATGDIELAAGKKLFFDGE